jgi:hypothetical protein
VDLGCELGAVRVDRLSGVSLTPGTREFDDDASPHDRAPGAVDSSSAVSGLSAIPQAERRKGGL